MTILATIIVLGVLIFVHELGHFAAAKAVGIEVQRFSIGLGPRVWGVVVGETDYVISAIPLGGYVKMGGMGDEVLERVEGGPVEEERTPGPRDFDAKPIWARTLVISAGVLMNFAFAWFSYSTTLAVWGFREPATAVVGGVFEETLPAGTEALGALGPGDRILRIGAVEIEHWGDVRRAFLEGDPGPTRIVVAGRSPVEFRLPTGEDERALAYRAVSYWRDATVGPVNPGSPAEEAGIEMGDRVLAVDDRPVDSWWDFQRLIEARGGEPTEVKLERDGSELLRRVTPEPTEVANPRTGERSMVGKVGVYPPAGEWVHKDATLAEAVVFGYRETVAITGVILGFLRDLVTGNVSPRSLGSIVTIGEASGQAASMGVEAFLRFMALFSVNLAVLNLLPIPILDGGHLLFLGIEAVRGKALSVEQRLRWSNVGFLIVMGIMIWALSNDVLKLLGL